MLFRRLLIRFFTPLAWRLSPGRKCGALQEFSTIEKDSGCQLLSAIDRVHDPKIQATLFQHVLEEFHHADLFERACQAYATAPLETPVITRDALLDPEPGPNDLLDFVSYVHVGESAVNGDFGAYAKAPIDARIRGVFAAVRTDEEGHEESSFDLLSALAQGSKTRLRWALLKSRAKRSWRSYVLMMRGVGELPLTVLLSALYFLAGPLVAGALRRRLDISKEEHLKILRLQLDAFKAS